MKRKFECDFLLMKHQNWQSFTKTIHPRAFTSTLDLFSSSVMGYETPTPNPAPLTEIAEFLLYELSYMTTRV